jgi:hypothetical protein
MEKTSLSAADAIGSVLEEYAQRGVFKGYSRGPMRASKTTFRIRWHYDRMYECIFDEARGTLRFASFLPDVPADSPMNAALRKYVRARQSAALPAHRRLDPEKVQARVVNRSGSVSLSVQAKDGDYEYAARKLINLVHEIFLDFLRSGPYIDYLAETMGLDLDQY